MERDDTCAAVGDRRWSARRPHCSRGTLTAAYPCVSIPRQRLATLITAMGRARGDTFSEPSRCWLACVLIGRGVRSAMVVHTDGVCLGVPGRRRSCRYEEVGMPHALVTLLTSPRRGVLSTPTTPAGSADSDAEDIYAVARAIGVLAPDWVRTGCLYAAQPADAYAVLVMPCLPDATKRHNNYHRL